MSKKSIKNHYITDLENYLKSFLTGFDTKNLRLIQDGNLVFFDYVEECFKIDNREFVVPFFRNKVVNIYMGITLTFSSIYSNTATPIDISLRYFLINENYTIKLFRAEYSRNVNNHCQPHWHFHIEKEEKPSSSFDEFEKSEITGYENPNLNSAQSFIERIHFVMAWDGKSNIVQFDSSLNWVKTILTSIHEELNYAYS